MLTMIMDSTSRMPRGLNLLIAVLAVTCMSLSAAAENESYSLEGLLLWNGAPLTAISTRRPEMRFWTPDVGSRDTDSLISYDWRTSGYRVDRFSWGETIYYSILLEMNGLRWISAGDYFARSTERVDLSRLRFGVYELSIDLLYSIHLLEPFDSGNETRYGVNYVASPVEFRWEPVPAADRYVARIETHPDEPPVEMLPYYADIVYEETIATTTISVALPRLDSGFHYRFYLDAFAGDTLVGKYYQNIQGYEPDSCDFRVSR